MHHQTIDEQITFLKEHLNFALATPSKKFSEIKYLKKQGLYIVFQGNDIIYIGKTARTGKTRLQEMTSDYRSHTLNRKLLKEHVENILGQTLPKFNKETKRNLIAQSVLTELQFRDRQQSVNNYIRTELVFKFYEFENNALGSLEHFAIAIFNPLYND